MASILGTSTSAAGVVFWRRNNTGASTTTNDVAIQLDTLSESIGTSMLTYASNRFYNNNTFSVFVDISASIHIYGGLGNSYTFSIKIYKYVASSATTIQVAYNGFVLDNLATGLGSGNYVASTKTVLNTGDYIFLAYWGQPGTWTVGNGTTMTIRETTT
jgi:hypothetical protein